MKIDSMEERPSPEGLDLSGLPEQEKDDGGERATALAVGPADEILVGGDRKVLVLASDGSLPLRWCRTPI